MSGYKGEDSQSGKNTQRGEFGSQYKMNGSLLLKKKKNRHLEMALVPPAP